MKRIVPIPRWHSLEVVPQHPAQALDIRITHARQSTPFLNILLLMLLTIVSFLPSLLMKAHIIYNGFLVAVYLSLLLLLQPLLDLELSSLQLSNSHRSSRNCGNCSGLLLLLLLLSTTTTSPRRSLRCLIVYLHGCCMRYPLLDDRSLP